METSIKPIRRRSRNIVRPEWLMLLIGFCAGPAISGTPSHPATPTNTSSAAQPKDPVISIPTTVYIQKQFSRTDVRLDRLSKAIKEGKPGWLEKLMPLFVGILGALLGWLSTFYIQRARLKHDEKLEVIRLSNDTKMSRDRAIFEAQGELIRAHSNRREQLYAPLRTLLGQSKEVYDQMCRQLKENDSSKKYEWHDDPDSTSGQSFVIVSEDGSAEPFRLLSNLPDCYKKGYGVDALIDEIILIGEQIAETIKKSAGLVIPDQEELDKTLSEYLSHFVVMKEVRDSVISGGNVTSYAVGYYPRGLNKQVDEGFSMLTTEIKAWEVEITRLSKQLFESINNER